MHDKQLAIKTYLITTLNAPWRTYHNEQHINFLLGKAAEWQRYQTEFPTITQHDWEAIKESIWWHDIVYNIWNPAKANETESAIQAVNTLRNMYLPNVLKMVYKAIMATAYHLDDQELTDEDMVTKVMLDVDMAGFGEEYQIVKINSTNVLTEAYMVVGDTARLLQNRVKFLTKLLERKRIFYTDYFFATYEAKARANIKRQIEETTEELKDYEEPFIAKPDLNQVDLDICHMIKDRLI